MSKCLPSLITHHKECRQNKHQKEIANSSLHRIGLRRGKSWSNYDKAKSTKLASKGEIKVRIRQVSLSDNVNPSRMNLRTHKLIWIKTPKNKNLIWWDDLNPLKICFKNLDWRMNATKKWFFDKFTSSLKN